jgi:hypothetical protein
LNNDYELILKNMPYETITYNVMIASPSDVNVERAIVREIIHEWNGMHSESTRCVLMPIGWDTNATPTTGARGQAIINTQLLSRSDLLVAIFWTRIGTPTGQSVSGTAEEIQEHIAANKPAMIYFSEAPVRPDSVDDQQYKSLQKFKQWCQSSGLIETYDNQQDFRDKFRRQLATLINKHELFASQRVEQTNKRPELNASEIKSRNIPHLSAEAQHLLLEASVSLDGIVGKIAFIGGGVVQSNGKNFVEPNNPRSRAIWEGAISELVELGLLEPVGYKGEVFKITREGYELADIIKQ